MGITAEIQKGHTYYRCTRKNKAIKCTEPYVREENLDRQLCQLLQKFSLKENWAEELLKMLEKDKAGSAQFLAAFIQETKTKIAQIQNKLQRLLDSYLEQDIEREIYLKKKAELMLEKKSLEEQIIRLEQKRTGWLEPMKKWIKEAENLPKIAREGNLFSKKVAAKDFFGSNLILANREARLGGPNGTEFPAQTHWAALRAAHQMVSKKPFSLILVSLLYQVRTYFQNKVR